MQKALLLSLLAAVAYTAKSCGCPKGDASCIAKCFELPDPTEDQAAKTNECITACTDGDGTNECFDNCINKIFKDYQKNGQTTTAAGSTPTPTTIPQTPKATTTEASKTTDAATTTASDKSASETTTGAATTKPKTTTSPKATGSANVQPIGEGVSPITMSSALTVFGLVASLFI